VTNGIRSIPNLRNAQDILELYSEILDYYMKLPEVDPGRLNERQKKAIEYLKISGKVTTKDYAKINDVSERTARDDLNDMVTKDIVLALGETNKRVFELRQNFGKTSAKTLEKQ